ncbi:MAG: type II toxin-antitoxin system RelE/ParE family toxin [Chloroflexaceae bacterium]|nr:type II toxin-antitoxin system RelE/ParE family toxin [Chloroflexaceae bacterium]NJL32917.1 type II toxin-antitoxin system RelE/ParE family toxin [Chloroflexaceae bacterium]NJO04487.1 type II toxin-antitoxin system RelE/ParE family toxin [Chloroflexaceae bacterium]
MLPGYVRAQALALLELLQTDPRSERSRELRDKPGIYRAWLATYWRVAYEIDDEDQVIRVRRVRRKDEMAYERL